MIKAGGAMNVIKRLFNAILTTTPTTPEQFKKVEIIVIYKKQDRQKFGNYKPISLLSHLYKLLM